ncbi:hypothetical protein CKA32_001570 [Geitlerinema sp. FC II]|uniref:hypothetical protein n=1 Tax=Baaleninema simplex TaxID=2862350 RepID=UPI000348108A|nr:hypothetical protein [Baaleninema simplex]MDC0834266.1 hypothetical protein [Geitlerinema sp. CS-897]PPT10336.1 hypothetical protein CKA32_001570 [Geitlerinema sp. FC II]
MEPTPTTSTPRPSLSPVSIALGVATAPILTAVWTSRTVLAALVELGETSEELFRGDRLPMLFYNDDEEMGR